MKNKDFLKGSIYKQILIAFFPIFLGTLFQQFYNTVDAVIVGKFVGKEALSAVGGTTGTLINLLVNFITGIASGASIVVAQYYGARKFNSLKKTVIAGMVLAILLGLIMMAIGIIFTDSMLKMMNTPLDIFQYSKQYMIVYFLGLIPSMIYNMGSGILRAIGDFKRPLYFLIVACFTNIVLDIIFVLFFKMAVFGVALATVISQIISCLLTLKVLSVNDNCSFRLKDLKFVFNDLKYIMFLGLPNGIQSTLYSISNVIIQSSVNNFGSDTIAAYTAYSKIDVLFWAISGAIGTASMTLVGHNYGANNIKRVKEIIYKSTILFIIITIIVSGFVYITGDYLLLIFTNDQVVIKIGLMIIKYIVPFWVLFTFVEILSSCIRACGDSLTTMFITAFTIAGFRIIYIILIPGNTILETLTCYPISWGLASLIFIIYYFSGIWLKRCEKQKIVNA